jgi:hypothetical protein
VNFSGPPRFAASSTIWGGEALSISTSYFGAMFTDLDGHRIEVKTDGT